MLHEACIMMLIMMLINALCLWSDGWKLMHFGSLPEQDKLCISGISKSRFYCFSLFLSIPLIFLSFTLNLHFYIKVYICFLFVLIGFIIHYWFTVSASFFNIYISQKDHHFITFDLLFHYCSNYFHYFLFQPFSLLLVFKKWVWIFWFLKIIVHYFHYSYFNCTHSCYNYFHNNQFFHCFH